MFYAVDGWFSVPLKIAPPRLKTAGEGLPTTSAFQYSENHGLLYTSINTIIQGL
jgi:hypothetical protein